jgi:hypothetical protein
MLHTAPLHVVSNTSLIIPLFLSLFHNASPIAPVIQCQKNVCLPGWPVLPIVSFFFPCLVYVKILSETQTMQYQKLDGNELPTVKGKNVSAHNLI